MIDPRGNPASGNGLDPFNKLQRGRGMRAKLVGRRVGRSETIEKIRRRGREEPRENCEIVEVVGVEIGLKPSSSRER